MSEGLQSVGLSVEAKMVEVCGVISRCIEKLVSIVR